MKGDQRGPHPQLIQALDRGMVILETLAGEEKDASLSSLAARFPWDKSTTHRLLATLRHRGYVDQDPETGRYRLGLALLTLSGALTHRLDIRQNAALPVEELALASRETAHLAVYDRGEVVILLQTDSPEKVRIHTYAGMRIPAHCSSLGKVLLAGMAEAELENWGREAKLQRYTAQTLATLKSLKAHLVQVRRQGYGFDDQEYEAGIRCLAGRVKNSEGQVVAAVGISGPSHRLPPEKRPHYIELVRGAAERISRSLGFVSP
jgi:DNA-binding IclR family transcriptional regulator